MVQRYIIFILFIEKQSKYFISIGVTLLLIFTWYSFNYVNIIVVNLESKNDFFTINQNINKCRYL